MGVYRSGIYLPMVFSLAVTGLFWRVLYQPDGAINALLAAIGIDTPAPVARRPEHGAGGDPCRRDLAAGRLHHGPVSRRAEGLRPDAGGGGAVDGASWWQRFRYIVFPQLSNVNTVIFAVTVIDSLRTFDIVWAMTRGGPYNSTQLLSTYMYQVGFTPVNLGYGSAIAVVIFLLAIAFIITYLVRATREED